MPEGDTIFRIAQRLRPVLLDGCIVEATDNGRFIDSHTLIQHRMQRVDAKGKHLLMHLDDARVLHSHMGMTGSWHLYRAGEAWRKSAKSAAVSMVVEQQDGACQTIVCFAPKVLELLTPTQFRRHDHLNRLGPDLMVEPLDEAEILRRFRLHNLASIGDAVLNQTILCGMGNVYKSECLFLTRTNPFVAVQHFSDQQILQIVRSAHTWLRKNVGGRPRQTRLALDGQRLWVYGRSGEACLTCGSTIEMRRQGDLGRSTYWCRVCQAEPPMSDRQRQV